MTLTTADGLSFDGRIVQADLSDDAAVVLLQLERSASEPLVVPLESIVAIEQR